MNDVTMLSTDIDKKVNIGNSMAVDKPECCKSIFISSDAQLSVLTQNIRSINHNFDELQVLLTRLDIEFDLIVLTECWLSADINLPSLTNYQPFSTNRNLNQNDGIVIYIKTDLSSITTEPTDFQEANCLVTTIGSDSAIISIYRPPSYRQINNFISSLDLILEKLKRFKNIVVLGDMNINIVENEQDNRANDYLDMLTSHGLLPSHKLPTRGSNCLDHCIVKTNLPNMTIVCDSSITDHSSVMISLSKLTVQKNNSPKTYKKIDYQSALAELDQIDWVSMLQGSDVNEVTNVFLYLVNRTLKKFTKILTVSHRKRNMKPWVTPGVIRCLRNRDKLHQTLKKDPDNIITRITYKRYRNTCNRMLNNLKRDYQRSLIKQNQRNLKKQWAIVKQICNLNETTANDRHLLALKSSPQESLNYVNTYFTNIGKELADATINKTQLSEAELVKSMNSECTKPLSSMMMLPTDENEVKATIQSLKNTNSTGWDGISACFLKLALGSLSLPITLICNLCLSTGKFPDALKKSVVVPIYKSGDRDCISNYRPISLLPTIAKVLEKIINKRLKSYLEKNNLLSTNQHGFRERKSTLNAAQQLTSFLVDKLDKNKKTLGIFLDLKKAFDTVSVPILIKKLENIGIRGLPLQLFQDYLNNRKQIVKVGEHYSDEECINYGVPQGSVLGPTLFLVYIDDLCRLTLTNAQIITFADDTVTLFYGNSWDEVNSVAQAGFNLITGWLRKNLLTLNLSKTKLINFTINNKNRPGEGTIAIKAHTCQSHTGCSCLPLAETSSIRYLGIQVDKNLNWQEHIDILTGRVRKLIYIFKILRHVCDKKLLIEIYYALCQSIICYCITIWGNASKTAILKLERAQRMILKVMTFKGFRHSTTTLYRDNSVLTVRQLFIQQLVLLQHKIAPDFPTTRRRNDIVYSIPMFNTKFAKRFERSLGPVIYNKLSKNISLRTLTLYSCKSTTSEYLKLQNYENTEQLLK